MNIAFSIFEIKSLCFNYGSPEYNRENSGDVNASKCATFTCK